MLKGIFGNVVHFAESSRIPAEQSIENELVRTNERRCLKNPFVQKPKVHRCRDDPPLPRGWKKITIILWRTESGSLRDVCRKTEPLVAGALKI